jgi:endonuclease/exonuclease/phosphatase family metal-dependent hydrolase
VGDFNSTDGLYATDSQKERILKYVYNGQKTYISKNVVKLMKREGFDSAINTPTTWSNIQTDYIFTSNCTPINAQVLFTPHSDHLPLIIDIPYSKVRNSPFTKKLKRLLNRSH